MSQTKIEILSETELVNRLESGGKHFTHCISIRNPDQRMPEIIRKSFKSILELKFYDVELVEQLGPEQKIKRVPERIDVKGVIEYFQRTKNDATGYIIHCWQGISRSPAVAFGLLYIITESEEKAAAVLKQIRPESRPHSILVRFFDEELGCHLRSLNEEMHRQADDAMRKELESLQDSHIEELVQVEEPKGLLSKAKAIRK